MELIQDAVRLTDYAMPSDFCQVYDDDLDHLYTLSLLLTADPHKAEKCFMSGLEDCLEGNPVFRESAHSWAKRTVIKQAIRTIWPTIETPWCRTIAQSRECAAVWNPITAITNLPPVERFVYVLSVLEKYSDQECAGLLGCTVDVIVRTRSQAMQHLVGIVTRQGARGN